MAPTAGVRDSIYAHPAASKDTAEITTVDLGNSERLTFEARREVLRLYPAAAGARIELQFAVAAVVPNTTTSTGPFHISADLYASRVRNQGERMVCRLTPTHLVTPTAHGAYVTLAGIITNEQLREIEEYRASQDLTLHLTLSVTTSTVTGPQMYRGDEYVEIRPGEWATELDRVEAATYVEVLVPMPNAAAFAQAARRIREARQLLRDNEIDAAMGAARLALEAVRDDLNTEKAAAAAPTRARDRGQAERTAVLVEAAYSVLCGAMHDDELTKTFVYTRTDAMTMIALAAGMVRRVSETG
jgi:hypothetical protein